MTQVNADLTGTTPIQTVHKPIFSQKIILLFLVGLAMLVIIGFGSFYLGTQQSKPLSNYPPTLLDIVTPEEANTLNGVIESSLENNSKDELHKNIQVCASEDLMLTMNIPIIWTCETNTLEPGYGEILVKGNNIQINVDNLGRDFGCSYNPNCVRQLFYDSFLINLESYIENGKTKFIGGDFNDNTDTKSYGAVLIKYEGELNVEQRQELKQILNSFKRTR